jgi:hypothetical protein
MEPTLDGRPGWGRKLPAQEPSAFTAEALMKVEPLGTERQPLTDSGR